MMMMMMMMMQYKNVVVKADKTADC